MLLLTSMLMYILLVGLGIFGNGTWCVALGPVSLEIFDAVYFAMLMDTVLVGLEIFVLVFTPLIFYACGVSSLNALAGSEINGAVFFALLLLMLMLLLTLMLEIFDAVYFAMLMDTVLAGLEIFVLVFTPLIFYACGVSSLNALA